MLNLRLFIFRFGQIAEAHQNEPQRESRDGGYDPDEGLADAGAVCQSEKRDEAAADGRERSHDAARTHSDEKHAQRADSGRTGKKNNINAFWF